MQPNQLVDLSDPYRFLEESSPRTLCWVAKEESLGKVTLAKYSNRKRIAKRLRVLHDTGTIQVSQMRGPLEFFRERKKGHDLAVLYVRDKRNCKPRVLIDPNTLSEDKTTTLSSWSVSRDGKLLAYELSKAGNDRTSIHIMDVDTGLNVEDVVSDECYPSFQDWNLYGTGFWYTRSSVAVTEEEKKYYHHIYYHIIGFDWKEDEIVWSALDSKEDIPVIELSDNGRWLVLGVCRWHAEKEVTEILVADQHVSPNIFVSLTKGVESQFGAAVHRNTLYVTTNHNAPNWKILSCDLEGGEWGMGNWQTVVPESKFPITSSMLVRDVLFVEMQENVSSHLYRYDLSGDKKEEICLPMIGTLGAWTSEAESDTLYLSFCSFFMPDTIYRYSLSTGKMMLHRKVKAGIRSEDFALSQVWYPSKDGTMIPMFLLSKPGMVRDGSHPTLLYGYGGFDVSITPSFDREALCFIEEGGVYAIANIRGGGEFGKAWHDAGRREHKQNVFDDFIAAAEWLIADGHTSAAHLGISGWSNGGLLTSVVMNQRPELFGAVVVGAPVTDMLRFHLFDGGRYWIYDYGDPDNAEDAKVLLAYCPYRNAKHGTRYPATLILTADKDDRVSPMHAFKIAARIKETNAGNRPIILRVERQAGHSGASSVSAAVDQSADTLAFLLSELK